ncbi:hypothetical protein L1987_47829 [Smallanthus sonchifolius]|uniref:Uncharacterized protein n=1 Tax=Smallanthus sonchifolius TaxID=185202 RepID=A0ACB9FPM7_9ASTR|nr:hypothetical protein L1987_47829 [Smallanthus sonchifolius]
MTEKSPLLPSNILKSINHNQNQLCVNPRRSIQTRIPPVKAAISDDLAKFVNAEKAVTFKVRAVLTVRNKHQEDFKETLVKKIDAIADHIGRNVVLVIHSTDIDPKTRAPKRSKESVLKDWSQKSNLKSEKVNYTSDILVGSDFGIPGAISITNKHQKEFYLEGITIEGFACGPVYFPCNYWVQSTNDHPNTRVFFSNQVSKSKVTWKVKFDFCLSNRDSIMVCSHTDQTPAGLKLLREKELRDLRGDGRGVRKLSDRIYDYDVYNDLGNPDRGSDFIRPILGGQKIPYPRRCRTGRLPSDTDILAESRVEKPFPLYVPRDERFEESKQITFSTSRLKAVLHNLLPSMVANISKKHDFKGFSQIESLYSEGVPLKFGLQDDILKKLRFPNIVSSQGGGLLKFDIPEILSKDKFAWLRDDEFARQALAGVNPVNIEKLKVFPPVSQLDPEIYGLQESALKEDHISGYLNGMTVQQAMEENKLFIVDHHDIYLPFLERINALEGRKAYATRTIFFLNPSGTLKPIAIELSLPRALPGSQSKRVVTPPIDATSNWTWLLAKAHVCSNDSGVHQLANHWIRTHATMEPFILSAHRQLSAMHPIYKLLDPHMRYTLETNAIARQNLVNADGVIEQGFTPGRYAMEISAAAYKNWRFDLEGLPADLIRRGMAIPDPSQLHGLKLLIDDYPYASDGLLIWEAIQNWVQTYVTQYYPDPSLIRNDRELQAWYAESVNVGHADLRNETYIG